MICCVYATFAAVKLAARYFAEQRLLPHGLSYTGKSRYGLSGSFDATASLPLLRLQQGNRKARKDLHPTGFCHFSSQQRAGTGTPDRAEHGPTADAFHSPFPSWRNHRHAARQCRRLCGG
jgi:hypothetical protein